MISRAAVGLGLLAICLGGCGGSPNGGASVQAVNNSNQAEATVELLAKEDIAAGTVILDGSILFKLGKIYYVKGYKPPPNVLPVFPEAPDDLFPGGYLGILKGRKVSRALKKDETVKKGDIVERDDKPFNPNMLPAS